MNIEPPLILLMILGAAVAAWWLIFHRGYQLMQAKRYEEAIKCFDWLARTWPRLSVIFNNRGYCRYMLKDTQGALEDYDRALIQPLKDPIVHFNRGMLFYALNEHEKALKEYDEILEIDPDNSAAFYGKSIAFYSLEDYDSAIENINQTIAKISGSSKPEPIKDKRHPLAIEPPKKPNPSIRKNRYTITEQLSNAYNLRGRCFIRKQELQTAQEDFERAIDINPANCHGHYNLGFTYYLSDQLELALENYRKVLEINAEFAPVYHGRGTYYFEKGDLQAALQDFSQAQQLEPDEDYPLADLAITRHALGEIETAQDLWRALLEKDNQHNNPDWIAKTYDWNVALIREAERLTASLQ